MSTQTPSLDKGDMTAAERANLQLTEQTIVMLVQFLRNCAARYPLNLRKQLSEPHAETKVDITFGTEKLFSATLGADNKLKKTQINKITDSQAKCLQEALSKQKGETLDDTQTVRNMRVLVNGISLFEVKDGKVVQNDLPPEFCKAIGATIEQKPLEVSLNTSLKAPDKALPEPSTTTNSTSNVANNEPSNTPNSTSNVASNEPSNTPNTGQEQLNRNLIAEAKKFLDRLFPNQPVGERQWKHDKYTITEKGGALSVYSAETNSTVHQDKDVVIGNARHKDVDALTSVNAAIDQNMGKSTAREIQVDVEA